MTSNDDTYNWSYPSFVKSDQKEVKCPKATTASRSKLNGHVGENKNKGEKEMKIDDSSVKLDPVDKTWKETSTKKSRKQEDGRPESSKHRSPSRHIDICQNNGSNQKEKNKKDTADNRRVMDNLEDPLVDVRTLFNHGRDFRNGVRNKRTKHKASNNSQTSVPTVDNLFHCYQNEIEAGKDKSKEFIGYQKSDKANHDNGAHDFNYRYQNKIKIGKDEHKIFNKRRGPININFASRIKAKYNPRVTVEWL
ncbi:hypothetical protein C2G38_446998 [Gigaspora rosea]|uniref:Uncharacterized protein n=1 Tax=Gigaspora rosea TaxID=44941 RepID=A0A397VX70_9GLOM|nr:hypothetical protein C2G38_446998 [Gigaspora rosea]